MVALVTGGSSGIGKAAADALRDAGLTVYEISRRGEDKDGIRHITADVTNDDQVAEAVKTIVEGEGGIDILVNNAGFGISGAIEFTDTASAKKQMDVNFFGMVNVTKQILPVMRRRGSGSIVNVSSVAGPVPIPFQAFYSASKAAVNAYTLALRNEVRPYGITVCAIMPGDTKTGFTGVREKEAAGDAEYGGRISRSVKRMEHDETNGMSAVSVGRLIAKLALKKDPKPLSSVRFDYSAAVKLAGVLPVRLLNRVIGDIYAK